MLFVCLFLPPHEWTSLASAAHHRQQYITVYPHLAVHPHLAVMLKGVFLSGHEPKQTTLLVDMEADLEVGVWFEHSASTFVFICTPCYLPQSFATGQASRATTADTDDYILAVLPPTYT
ncbi:hypothetical protein B0T17DRAFT_129326 [Bombardia bombarda]|uniref:Uncharacterized protein n=1 Tax=Bombardia bombarda TaxID=252184 RepID=A0AA39TJP0_9PEZI|nr:hypothetical protein B0T17DRAFT_129326 [Bombardia bombarda]